MRLQALPTNPQLKRGSSNRCPLSGVNYVQAQNRQLVRPLQSILQTA